VDEARLAPDRAVAGEPHGVEERRLTCAVGPKEDVERTELEIDVGERAVVLHRDPPEEVRRDVF